MLTQARSSATAQSGRGARLFSSRIPLDLWLLGAVTLLAAVLRFATLTDQSYWFDEAQAAHELHLSFGAMLSSWSANEPNPPLYFVLAWPWTHVFGNGEAALRSLSALIGTAVVPIAYWCARELVSRRAGVVAAAFAALSPFLIWYSQEAREYILLAALTGASVALLARAVRELSARRVAAWAVISALALATQYFAVFLIAAEAAWLLWTARSRPVLLAVILLAAVELALLPHAISHQSHPAGWIGSVGPLSVRLKQVPITFAFNTLYKSSLVSSGLIGAAALAAVVIALLVIGADAEELRGAALAAGLAAAVLVVPLLLAVVGRDYFEPRALTPAWIPLAVVVAAACTARRALVPGAVLGVAICGSFIWANIRIDHHAAYQRQDWRAVARALGPTRRTRAIVAYEGTFATAPLALYLPGVSWASGGQDPQPDITTPVTVSEIDVIGNAFQRPSPTLPSGIRSIGSSRAAGFLIRRYLLAPAQTLTRARIAQLAPALLGPAPPGGKVIVQRPS
jgi:4-amino-4-deoxy-L-arabinose transferase-like glycosyltransferase